MIKSRILVTGDRFWQDYKPIYERLAYENPNYVIQGGASGADKLAEDACLALGYVLEKIGPATTPEQVADIMARRNRIVFRDPADWGYPQFRSGGPIRNSHMLKIFNPTLVLAFHNNFNTSKGTYDMVGKALRHNIVCELYTTNSKWRTLTKEDMRSR